MKRRNFIKCLSAAPIVAYLPLPAFSAEHMQSLKTLILVQLAGGNDSLNAFVPIDDAAYYQARPSLAIQADEALALNAQLGLNPVMSALLPSWQNSDIAIVHGLGYPEPNRSHFRSIEIWQTASESDEVLNQGWLTSMLPTSDELQAVTLAGSTGHIKGESEQFTLTANPQAQQLLPIAIPQGTAANSAIEYVVEQQLQYNQSIDTLKQIIEKDITTSIAFPPTDFGQQCQLAAQLLVGGLQVPILHLSLGSFDTHNNQRGAQDALLAELAEGLAALRNALIEADLWSNTTIASYAEFGRRVAENASKGTDHGTAASHLVMGGAVNGGVIGAMPSLHDLDAGDMIFTQDFRSYYRTLSDWIGWQASEQLADFDNLGFLI